MMRLDKLLSELTPVSRRELKQIIRAGRVTVNEICVVSGEQKVDPERDRICLDGTLLCYRRFRTFAMDKPTGVLTAARDRNQLTVLDLLPSEWKGLDLFLVGRLDKDTSGLLLLTNDGEFAHQVISPKYQVKKTYLARTEGTVTPEDQKAFAEGLILRDGLRTLPAVLEPCGNDRCFVTVEEGKYHQVRRMLSAVGKPVLELRRLSIGGLKIEELSFQNGFCELSSEQCDLVLPGYHSKMLKK